MCSSPSWCSLCRKDGESIDHILLHRNFTIIIWSGLLQIFGIVGAFPEKWSDFLINWSFSRNSIRKLNRFGSMLCLLVVLWMGCLEREKSQSFRWKMRQGRGFMGEDSLLASLWVSSSKFFGSSEAALLLLNWEGSMHQSHGI